MRVTPAQSIYHNVYTGEIGGETSATQMPNIPCKLACFVACSGNATNVYIGTSSSVSVKNGTTDTTTGFELDAGAQTPWLPIPNLNKLYYICDATGDDLTYIALK